jgi:phosphatidylglycerophosphate synthase
MLAPPRAPKGLARMTHPEPTVAWGMSAAIGQRGWLAGSEQLVGSEQSLLTVPNVITAVRTIAAIVLAMLAVVGASPPLTLAAFLCYWVGDVLDGLAARLLDRETRFGAVLDILADRACCALCVAALVVVRPEMVLPLTIYLVHFMVVDCHLSLAFLRWPLVSPNYFHLVHRATYLWNWSPPAKAVNTSILVILVLATDSPVYATGFGIAVATIKIVSLVTVSRLPAPSPPRQA